MKTISVDDCKEMRLGEILKLVKKGDVVILTQNGQGRYVVGPVDDLEWEALSLSRNAEFMTYLDACRTRGDSDGSTPLHQVRKQFEKNGTR